MELIDKAKALELLQMVVDDVQKSYEEGQYVSYQETAGRCYRLIASMEPEEVRDER